MDDETLELLIPTTPEYVGAARLFVAAAGRHFELGEEAVADVKVAVSEVCAGAAEDSDSLHTLRIEIRAGLEGFEVDVEPHLDESVNGGSRPPVLPVGDDLEVDFREALVRALFPEATYKPEAHLLKLTVPWELPEEPDDF